MPEIITCKSCRNKVLIGDLKADKSGSGWVCLNCYKQQHPNIFKDIVIDKKIETKSPIPSRIPKIKYYCSNCGYKFTKEPGYKSKCPYCSLYAIREERDAESLIRESMEKEDLFFKKDRSRIQILDD